MDSLHQEAEKMTTFQDYCQASLRTFPHHLNHTSQVDNIALGIEGECGELLDLYKKHRYHGHAVPAHKWVNEVGDLLWYLASAYTAAQVKPPELPWPFRPERPRFSWVMLRSQITALVQNFLHGDRRASTNFIPAILECLQALLDHVEAGVALEEVADLNIDKLKIRYPDGFNSSSSVARADTQPLSESPPFAAEDLVALRSLTGMTQTAFGEECFSISRGHQSHLETGRAALDLPKLLQVMEFMRRHPISRFLTEEQFGRGMTAILRLLDSIDAQLTSKQLAARFRQVEQ